MILTLRRSFDASHTFLRDRFIKREGKNKDLVSKALHVGWWLLTYCCRKKKKDDAQVLEQEAEKLTGRSLQPFTFIPVHTTSAKKQGLKVEGVARTIIDRTTKKKRTLFQDVTEIFQAGEISLVSGPSGR